MILADLVRRASLDPEFKQRFTSNPRGSLKELGYILKDGIELRVLEDTPQVMHVILPIDGWVDVPDAKEADRIAGINSGVCNSSASSHTCCYVDPPDVSA